MCIQRKVKWILYTVCIYDHCSLWTGLHAHTPQHTHARTHTKSTPGFPPPTAFQTVSQNRMQLFSWNFFLLGSSKRFLLPLHWPFRFLIDLDLFLAWNLLPRWSLWVLLKTFGSHSSTVWLFCHFLILLMQWYVFCQWQFEGTLPCLTGTASYKDFLRRNFPDAVCKISHLSTALITLSPWNNIRNEIIHYNSSRLPGLQQNICHLQIIHRESEGLYPKGTQLLEHLPCFGVGR